MSRPFDSCPRPRELPRGFYQESFEANCDARSCSDADSEIQFFEPPALHRRGGNGGIACRHHAIRAAHDLDHVRPSRSRVVTDHRLEAWLGCGGRTSNSLPSRIVRFPTTDVDVVRFDHSTQRGVRSRELGVHGRITIHGLEPNTDEWLRDVSRGTSGVRFEGVGRSVATQDRRHQLARILVRNVAARTPAIPMASVKARSCPELDRSVGILSRPATRHQPAVARPCSSSSMGNRER